MCGEAVRAGRFATADAEGAACRASTVKNFSGTFQIGFGRVAFIEV
jgi:hypothetical protein